MNNLMKDWETTEQFLTEIKLPLETESYSVVPHNTFISELKGKIKDKGYNIKNSFYKIHSKGLQLTGRYDIESDNNKFGMSMSFSNSYNKSMKAQVSAGVVTWACLNGKIFGDIAFSRKHTGDVLEELDLNINKCLNFIEEDFKKSLIIMEKLKEIEITKRICAELSGRAYMEEQIITSTQLSIIKDNLEFSTNFKEMNAYCLLEHFAEAAKTSHTSVQLKTLKNISNYFIGQFGILKEGIIYELIL